MATETQLEQPDIPERDVAQESAVKQPRPTRTISKTLLTAIVVGVMTIGVLTVIVGRVDVPSEEAHSAQSRHATTPSVLSAAVDTVPGDTQSHPSGVSSETIDNKLDQLTGWIKESFASLRADQSDIKNSLAAITDSLHEVRGELDKLQKGNEALQQLIVGAQARLETIATRVQRIKVAKRKTNSKQRQAAMSVPPFHIDAIDLWDDAVYVAVSQEGRVAFLRKGDQQSGWQVIHIDRLKGQVGLRGPAGQDYSVSPGG